MAKIQFYPIDIIYKVKDRGVAIYIYGKAINGERICVKDTSFKPYFYVVPRKKEDIVSVVQALKSVIIQKDGTSITLKDLKIEKKNFLGKEADAIKAIVDLPEDIKYFREEVKRLNNADLFESDIKFVKRYLIDKGIVPMTLIEVEGDTIIESSRVPVIDVKGIKQLEAVQQPKLKILAFDIETYNPLGKYMDAERFPIIMLSFYGEDFKKVITWKKFDTDLDYVEFVDGELELIEKFKEAIERYKPDMLVGYFSDGFDFPYIMRRAKRHKVELDIGLDYSAPKARQNEAVDIHGIAHVDIFSFIVKNLSRGLETDVFTLDEVAAEILGERKEKVDMDKLAEAWDNASDELSNYAKYNLKDSYLAYMLAVKIMPTMEEFVKVTSLPITEVNRVGYSQLVEWFIIKHTKDFNELIPNKPGSDEINRRKMRRYKGAFVFEPKPGVYDNIAVFDFRSLYPTIISSHNIGPGTINCKCCLDNKVPGEAMHVCKRVKGFIPNLIDDLIRRRLRVKEILKNAKEKNILLEARSESLKVLANSFYGYIGFAASRWYDFDAASAVTAYGRYHITKVIEEARNNGFNVIYSDTDSIFITLGNKAEKDAVRFMEAVNTTLPGLMELEYEGLYPAGIFVPVKAGEYGAKKRYALVNEKGAIKIRGFETVRRNTSPIAREVQENVLGFILKENNALKAVEYARDIISKVKKREIPVEKMIIFTKLRKDVSGYESVGPHVAAARRMKEKGMHIEPGSSIYYVIIPGSGVIRDRARLPSEVQGNEYDAEYYIENQIIPSVEKIFEVVGFSRDDFVATEQKKLGSWFG